MNIEFAKRMIVDSENLSSYRKRFFAGENFDEKLVEQVNKITPQVKVYDWGKDTLTLLQWNGLEHLEKCILYTIKNNVEGDFIETGVWRGGAVILAKVIYQEIGVNKKVFAADSFEGLPKPNPEKYPLDKDDKHYMDNMLKVSQEQVSSYFKLFNCLDENVIFLKGWFKDTLPIAPIDKLSILRLDGDMYESTWDGITNLYPKLSDGGYCIVDDYFHHKGCRKAVDDYRSKYNIKEPIIKVDDDPVNEVHYWVKGKKWSTNYGLLQAMKRIFRG